MNFSEILNDKNLYYVGGVVRDEFLKIDSIDTDLCYEGDAIEFARKNIPQEKIIKINPDFGTVRIKTDNDEIDIASTRTEYYPRKGHLPKIKKIGCPLKDDLIRRDFTINAMAKRVANGEIIDYFKGIEDIKTKTLRILHDDSFIDDPTRIIRGLKFGIRFGFNLDSHTKNLQDNYLKNVNYDMSYHRLKKELVEAFNINKAEVLERFIEGKMYRLLPNNDFVPKIDCKRIEKLVNNCNSGHKWLMYLSLFDLSALPLTRAEKRIIEWKEKLKTQKPTNNTPTESIIISEFK